MKKSLFPYRLAAFAVLVALPFGCNNGPDFEAPRVDISSLNRNAVISNAREIVRVDARDNEEVAEVELLINGQSLDRDLRYPWELRWQTDHYFEGNYLLTVRARDESGNAAEDTMTVKLRDVILIHEIEITNMCCDQAFGPQLEIEAHLYDSEGRFLGCAGEKSGLVGVNEDDTRYAVEAYFQKPPLGLEKLLFEEMKQKQVYLKIVEDDQDACPIQENATRDNVSSTDDELGRSATFAGESLASARVMGFHDVVYLKIAAGRTTQP